MQILKINFQTNWKKDSLDEFFYDKTKDLWFIESNVDSPEIDDHWNNIKEILDTHKNKLIGVSKVYIIVYDTDRLPPIMISSSMSSFLGEIQANIEIITQKKFLENISNKTYKKNNTFTSPIKGNNPIPEDFHK